MTTEVATIESNAHTLEQVVIVGDLAKLTPADRVMYYQETCRSLGLNPLTKPFQYIVLNQKLTLYATRTATDQLRALKGISIDSAERDLSDPEYATWLVTGHDAYGRIDMEIGSVSIKGLSGEAKANAIMKALTKGKRRLTLSLAGLGWMDETEVGSIPSAEAVDVDQETGEIRREVPLREQVAARRAAITSGPSTTLVPQEAGSGQAEVRDDPSGEPPLPVEAGALDATPVRSEPGNAIEGNPVPAPADSEGQCSAPSPYGDEKICRLRNGHRNAHRSDVATWLDK